MDYMVKQIEQLCGKKDAEGFRKYVLDNRKKLKLSKNCLNSPWTSWTNLANKRALRVAQVLRPWRSVASDLSKFFDDDRMQLAMSFQTKYLGMSPFQAPSLFTILSFLELEYGIYHAKGGLGTVTERMGALAEELGVEICLNEPVEECLFDGKKIVGVKTGKNTYDIELALAGFGKDDIEVQYEDNMLSVKSKPKKAEDKEDKEDVEKYDDGVLHRGISKRWFSKSFTIADDVEVKGAELKDGLLKVSMERIIPEGKKARTIEVK